MHNSDRKVLVLQHTEHEHLGHISEALRAERVGYTYLRPDLGQQIPTTLDGFDGLVLMGGPQAVYEEDLFPFLRSEKALVHKALSEELPILGVCLGSQILAETLGSHVCPSNMFELGWKKVNVSIEVADDPVLDHLPSQIIPFHWHGDIYDLPEGAKSIGSSELASVQGFVWNERAYGFLFHLEITYEQIQAMATEFPEDLRRSGTTPAALLSDSLSHIDALQELSLEVFRKWTTLL